MPDDLHIGSPVLERDEQLPKVALHPAPWQLQASAYVFVVRMPDEVLDREAFAPPSLAGKRCGNTSYFLYVDYRASNCGPYHEMMVAPAAYDFGEDRYLSITRIYVSTYDSVVNGRANWGIPKDRADFLREREGKIDHIQVSRDGHVIADMRFKPFSLAVPVTSWLLPSGLRTLMQHWQGKSYRFALSAKGSMRLGKVIEWKFDPKLFPDLARGKVIAGAHFPTFDMTFPIPRVQEGLL
jgi:hypothetical protein